MYQYSSYVHAGYFESAILFKTNNDYALNFRRFFFSSKQRYIKSIKDSRLIWVNSNVMTIRVIGFNEKVSERR